MEEEEEEEEEETYAEDVWSMKGGVKGVSSTPFPPHSHPLSSRYMIARCPKVW